MVRVMMRSLIRRAAVWVTVAAGAGVLAAGMPAAAEAGAATAGALAAGRGAAATSGTWGAAKEVPGTASLNAGGSAAVSSVSCASPGNCSAAGSYVDGAGHQQVFVVTETNGTWGKALKVPGLASLNTNVAPAVTSVSCASAGNCGAGGSYQDRDGHLQAFVVTQSHGVWATAKRVPGMASLNAGGSAAIRSVSCASAGNCSGGGYYRDGIGRDQAFVVTQVNGTWGKAVQVPGTAGLNAGRSAGVNSVSCASAGNCSAGGSYRDSSGHLQAFVATQIKGTWGKATQVPGTAGLNAGGSAVVGLVSCGSAGNCSAGGYYQDGSGHLQVFVVTQAHDTWGKAKEVPGTAALNAGGLAAIGSVSCASAGNCSAGGDYLADASHQQAFVVTQTNGVWGKAKEVPGTAALNVDGGASVTSVSCASAGNCSAGGYYDDGIGHQQAFVVAQTNGIWGTAKEVPGMASLNTGGFAAVTSVSCAAVNRCSAGGWYADSANHLQAVAVTES
jgi:D-alanine-D-alanine ligase-like ATP-grasp enzyme